MLELRAVEYRYPGYARWVLHGIDLTVRKGEVVGLVGANESGKSTLCLVASGLAPSSIGGELKGDLSIDGEPMRGRRPWELAQRVAVGFQDPLTQLSGTAESVFEEVGLGPMNLGLPRAESARRAAAALAALRVSRLAGRRPRSLSGGEAQLVALASLLAMRPSYLVLDEPTSELDPAGSELVGDALRTLAAETGTGVLIAEHKTDLLATMCERVVALDEGRIVLDGPAGAILADPRVEELGVEPPSRVRLERSLRLAGLDWSVAAAASESIR